MILAQSIRGRLFLGIFFAMTSLLLTFGIIRHHEFNRVVFDSVAETLHSKLQLVKGLMHEDGDSIDFEVDEIVLGEYVIPRSGHYYQIVVDGEVAAASGSLVEKSFDFALGRLVAHDEYTGEWIYTSVGPADEPLRVIRHDFEFMDKSITILVAESVTKILAMVARISRHFLIIGPLMIILVGLVGFLIASHSLRPLRGFSAAIEKITLETLDERIEKKSQARELQSLAETFNSLLTRLRIAFEAEKHLIADAAHELKTPLAVIRAQCDISLQKKRTAAEYGDSLMEIKSVSESMLRQINGMLTLARLDSGVLTATTFQEVLPQDCIEDAIRLVTPLAKNNRITLTSQLAVGSTVLANKTSLTEAILNILENAVRYNSPPGSVAVELASRGKQVIITIKDTGIGISEEERPRIFDRFYRAEATRSTEGSGLGLSITRAIIEAHHGTIEVTSEVSRGSWFIITIPQSDLG